ncbi:MULTISPECIES: bestrophin family protein [unclassified Variovorax]|uniref:bestrophin family protein n=1 Tax=unclassified Variovorax TaxID=663243 RepID=UPI002B2394D6|nr:MULTISPECIES: bestrophin family ion channel [unclassified Variovorax]MEB0058148.1 bestrophin family ion channel [Variovorax sp. LG9.2]MEB0112135.1 bestrophin family ion channel [Variovorax sp. RTB1]
MIVRPRPHWLRMLFVWRGSVLRDIAPQLLATTLFAIAITLLHGRVFQWKIPLNFVPFSLIGLTLAIFLGFRNSTSYARYWEARTLWGTLLNETRSLVRQALTLVDEPERASALTQRLIAFVHALRHQLRSTDPTADLARLLSPAECERLSAVQYKPAVLLLMAGEWLRDQRQAGRLAPALQQAMEWPLSRLSEALGGCERIASTPIPFTYAVIIHRTIYIYCVLLPFGLIDSIGPMTPVIVAFIAYTFFALEALAAEIEEPFGEAANDLALDAMSHMIESTLREMMGELAATPKPVPANFILT